MKKLVIILGLAIMVLLILMLGCGRSNPYNIQDDGFAVITAPLSLNEEENVTAIPYGSVIYHWANGITEVYDSDNNLLFIARDSEAAIVGAPGGFIPATHGYHIPDGSRISTEEDGTTKIYLDAALILTVIESERNNPIRLEPPQE